MSDLVTITIRLPQPTVKRLDQAVTEYACDPEFVVATAKLTRTGLIRYCLNDCLNRLERRPKR